MKIAIISLMNSAPWGGSEELWAATAFEALEQGHEVIVSLLQWPAYKAPKIVELENAGATIFYRKPIPPGIDAVTKTTAYFKRRYEQPFKPIIKASPDVLLVNQGGTYDLLNEPTLLKFLQDTTIPWYLLSQFNFDFGVLGYDRLDIAQAVFPKATGTLFVAERNRKTTERQLAMQLSNAMVVRNPVNLTDNSYVLWPASQTPIQFGCVARLDCNFKGQDILFEALSDLRWKERSWMLNLYGNGPDAPYLLKLAQHFDIADKINFKNHQHDIRSVWADNHILVLPSIGEGTPLSLVEAMICGRTAIVTDVAGNTEWIEDGVTGFVAEAASPVYIGKALEKAWHRSSQWESMGKKARELALQKTDLRPGKKLLDILTGKR